MKPSAKFKKRYILFKLSVDGKAPEYLQAKAIIHEHFLAFFGEMGIASLAFKLVKYDAENGKGILRCARESVDEAVFCMACLHKLQGKNARMEPILTSGTIRKLC